MSTSQSNNLNTEYTAFIREATSELSKYKSDLNLQSTNAAKEYRIYKSSVDSFTQALAAKKKQFDDSSSKLNSITNLYNTVETALKTKLPELISQVTRNIKTTEDSNKSANSEIASIRSKNLEISRNASTTAGHLATAQKAASDALISQRAADTHRINAKGYELDASRHATTAADYKQQTLNELEQARATNDLIYEEYKLAYQLVNNAAEDIFAANGTLPSKWIVNKRLEIPRTQIQRDASGRIIIQRDDSGRIVTPKENFINFYEGLENNDYSPDELRLFAIAKSAHDQENHSRRRLLQVSELLAQKDSVANNIIMDYIYKNEKGTNVSTIMDKVEQHNNDKKRKLEITTYYNKSREQYINVLKVIVLACIIIVPLVIANKKNMISNSIFMFIIVAIILFTIIFIFSTMVDIYKRDNMDFDKYNVPYDRQALILEKEGSIIKKKNPLTSLTLTCIGQDCCDGSMVYDKAKNKCIATENFGNIFDSFNLMNSNKQSIVYPSTEYFNNNCNLKNTMIQSSLACSSVDKFITNECSNSLQMQF
jgi:uncharacterized membrane protein (DUF485 family)